MFDMNVNQINDTMEVNKEIAYDDMKKEKKDKVMRFLDMQNVLAGSLAGPQQAVNNAENYPSTWTTNPDGGANGQVQ
jgi:hypothetical protein